MLPSLALAKNASLFVNPQYIILDDRKRHQTVHIVNQGDRTGVYEIDWVDNVMVAEGGVKEWTATEKSPWSLQPYIRYSPRRVTLKPGQTQVIRVAMKRGLSTVPEGEYFSHLKVRTLNDNLEQTLSEQASATGAEQKKTLTISAKIGISIPVIWRHSQQQPDATLTVATIDRAQNSIIVHAERLGKVSTRGFLHAYYARAGQQYPVTKPQPFIIYPNIQHRDITLSLIKPLPNSGELLLFYSENLDNIDQLISQTRFNLE